MLCGAQLDCIVRTSERGQSIVNAVNSRDNVIARAIAFVHTCSSYILLCTCPALTVRVYRFLLRIRRSFSAWTLCGAVTKQRAHAHLALHNPSIRSLQHRISRNPGRRRKSLLQRWITDWARFYSLCTSINISSSSMADCAVSSAQTVQRVSYTHMQPIVLGGMYSTAGLSQPS